MKIIDLDNSIDKKYETAVALGNFDGIHIGHSGLIENTVSKAKELGLKSAVLLFKSHTKMKLEDSSNMSILTSNDQKIEILKELGVDIIYTIEFNSSLMKLSPIEFVQKIIIGKLNAKLVTIGFDYSFGYKASGGSEELKVLGKVNDFIVNIVEPIEFESKLISSTTIRNLIREGNVRKANEFLGRPYSINGKVVRGENRGSKLGYPTANIDLVDNYTIPKPGVYKTITRLHENEYIGLTSVGYNPTFNGNILKIENHILNFNGNIYDEIINIKFMDFIRENRKFDDVEALIKQIENDIVFVGKNKY